MIPILPKMSFFVNLFALVLWLTFSSSFHWSWVLGPLYVRVPYLLVIFCDNAGNMQLCFNLVFHSHETCGHWFSFICDHFKNGALHVAHVLSKNQLVDALIKPLHRSHFLSLKTKIGICDWISILRGHVRKS